ncbi:MAG: transposase [Myxococcales bacterium]|nr:transposase [Myxococcales bacterium]
MRNRHRKRPRHPESSYLIFEGIYYVTLCTKYRQRLFGEVRQGQMCLNIAGAMVEQVWQCLPQEFPGLVLDEYIIMPDHLHGLLRGEVEQAVLLSHVIQHFKSVTTTNYIRGVRRGALMAFKRKVWQPGYYDHVVRDDADLQRIRRYIRNNPARWMSD